MNNVTRAPSEDFSDRLRKLVDETSEEELGRTIDGEWTVSATLAHIAFWDRRAALLIERFQQGDSTPSQEDEDLINGAGLPQWRLIPPTAAVLDALDAAAQIDDLLSQMTADQLAALRDIGVNYNRSDHRHEHLDQIAKVLGQS